MGTYIDDLKRVLSDFQDKVESDLEEIRSHKVAVQQIRAEIQEGMSQGLFYRDDKRLIISAPEIIIGNVDENGMLMDGASIVTVRGGEVNLQGIGEAGSVNTCASSIRQTAVDCGIDGKEEVVRETSQVVSQATSIVLESCNATGVFSKSPNVKAGNGGVLIHADSQLQLEASIQAESHKAMLNTKLAELGKKKSDLLKIANTKKKNFESIAKQLEDIIEEQENLTTDDNAIKTNIKDINKLQYKFDFYSHALKDATDSWIDIISRLAEVCRQKTAIGEKKDAIVVGDDYKKKSTGAVVSIMGENIFMVSADGEGNLRDNNGSGIEILAKTVGIESSEYNQSLKKGGSVSISAETINFETINPTQLEYDDNGELKKGQYPVVGDIFIRSKNISVEAVDREIKDGNNEEKALAKDSSIVIRAEKMDFNTTDTEGKATGSVNVNSKEVRVTSLDSSDNGNKVTDGSKMLLLSENMFLGIKSSDDNKFLKPKILQAISDKIGFFACGALAAKSVDGQGKTKSLLQLTENSASISGSKTQVYGDTTICAKLDVKGKVTLPDVAIDNLDVSKSLSAPDIKSGIKVSKPAQAEKPKDDVDVKESKLDNKN